MPNLTWNHFKGIQLVVVLAATDIHNMDTRYVEACKVIAILLIHLTNNSLIIIEKISQSY
jgi:general stress protein CsbA